MSARGLELEQAQAGPDRFHDKRARRDLSHIPHLRAAVGSRSDTSGDLPLNRRVHPSLSCRPALCFASRQRALSGALPLEGVSVAAMDRVGGGEKQLEDCTVSKSVSSPLSLSRDAVRRSPVSLPRFTKQGTPVVDCLLLIVALFNTRAFFRRRWHVMLLCYACLPWSCLCGLIK
jgi:hypothetical protein